MSSQPNLRLRLEDEVSRVRERLQELAPTIRRAITTNRIVI